MNASPHQVSRCSKNRQQPSNTTRPENMAECVSDNIPPQPLKSRDSDSNESTCSTERSTFLCQTDIIEHGETSRTWLVHFVTGEHVRRYQVPVNHERVMADHRAAIAAEPIHTRQEFPL